MIQETCRLNSTARSEIIATLIGNLHAHYVFPSVVEEMALALYQKQSNGEYDTIFDAEQFAHMLTNDLQAISKDKQLVVFYKDAEVTLDDMDLARSAGSVGAVFNYGFEKVERLAGNIGYLSIHTFFSPTVAVRAAITTMDFIAYTNALIIDVRTTTGGDPAMVNFFASYFFSPEPVHLNDIYWRANDSIQEFWTLPFVPGQRYIDRPIYILIGKNTPAAAEEFAYDLQSQQRATIIGEPTGGAANPRRQFQLTEQFACWIPVGRTINPITKTSWEGSGILPDREVSEENAFKTAYTLALKHVRAGFNGCSTLAQKRLSEEVQHVLTGLE
jgi:C-terminal processing protease CtpA/Prc